MRTAAMAGPENGRANWLLRGFLILSIGIHGVILVRIADVYRTENVRYIEIELPAPEAPAARSIPKPPRRSRTSPPSTSPRVPPAPPEPVTKPPPRPVAPKPITPRSSVVEPMAAPPPPEIAKNEPLAWHPPAEPADPAPQPPAKESNSAPVQSAPSALPDKGASQDYFTTVRARIERHKHYPFAARRRRMEGAVAVRFILHPDGRVTDAAPADPSGHRLLNQAALKAVRDASPFPQPPAGLFSGPTPLEISIVFELK
ncbi:MAG: energy transducer TonB family protein [Thermodesulfobacteriota bacterium]